MNKDVFAIVAGVCLMAPAPMAMAKKSPPPSDVIDYDISGFSCPATVASNEPVELRVEVVNVGPADPGVTLQIREEDALLGPTLVVNEVVFDALQPGRKQKPTEYVYHVYPTYQQTFVQWSASLFDDNHIDDLDWAFCDTQIIWE